MATPNSLPPAGIDYFSHQTYQETAKFLTDRLPDSLKKIQVGIVCGSGLGGLVKGLEAPTVEFEYKVLSISIALFDF